MKLKKIVKTIIVILSTLVLVASILFYGIIYFRFNSVKGYIISACNKYGVSESLAVSVAYVESKFDSNAVSKKGAEGVMQVMPSTAKFIAKKHAIVGLLDLKDAKTNVELGVAYLGYLIDKFSSEVIALSAYNAGEGNVVKWLDNGELDINKIPFNETKNYVKKVLKLKSLIEKRA